MLRILTRMLAISAVSGFTEVAKVLVLKLIQRPGVPLGVFDGNLADKVGLFELRLGNLERWQQLTQGAHAAHVRVPAKRRPDTEGCHRQQGTDSCGSLVD